jgi:fucose 4-O-acetylase-like acetyltransferase
MTQRTDWLDYGKGIGIILVVYGHLLSSGYHAGLPISLTFFELSDSVLYTFHMPLFFVLAGLVVENSYRKRGVQRFLVDKCTHLAYPYLLWAVLQTSAELVFSNHVNNPVHVYDLLALPYRPREQFWFLYALMWMYFVYALCRQTGRFAIPVMALIAIGLFAFPIRTDIAALYNVCIELPFFVLGVGLSRFGMANEHTRAVPVAIPLALSVMFVTAGLYVFTKLITPTRLTVDYGSHPFYLLSLALLGTTCCIGWSQYLAQTHRCGVLRLLGTYSLQIFLAHMLVGVAVRTLLLQMFHLHNPVFHIFLGVLAALIAPILLFKLSLRLQVPYLFNWRRMTPVPAS